MRAWAFLPIFLALGGCQTANSGSANVSQAQPTVRPVSDGAFPDEVVEHKRLSSPIAGQSILRARRGTTTDGLPYSYYSDGSGSVETGADSVLDKWTIGCTVDKMNDKRKCTIKNQQLFISYGFGLSPQLVCVRYHDFPGRTGAIRLDSGAPIPTDKQGCVSGVSIAAALWKAKLVRTRGVKWPYDHNRDSEVDSHGLHGAHLIVVHMQKNLEKLSFD